MNRFVDDENFNRPILYAIPTVFEEAKNDERLRSKCMSLLSSIFSASKNKEVKSTAVTIALDLAKIESRKSTVESYIYEVFALKMNAIDFNEQIHFKLIELLKSENKDYSMWLLRLVSKSNDKRYISIIKADFLNNCKNEYKNRNTCFHAKCALAQLGDKQYQKEVFANLSSINSKDLVEYYLPSVSFIRIPESSNLLVKIMNDNTCKMIYDFDTNEQEPCSAKVINTIVEMTSNVPQELKKVSNGASPDSKKVEQSKKWINQNKNKLKMRTETY